MVIPIVFHVLYSSDEEKVSEKQITAQIEALNRDFGVGEDVPDDVAIKNKKTYEAERFDRVRGRINISFCIANKNENGVILKGIKYHTSKSIEWGYDNALKSSGRGGVDPWETDRYLNVWVARLPDHINGYAQMPGWDKETDGIVIDDRFIQAIGDDKLPYGQGKTMTHLVANYLGVPSLWQGKGCEDDGIDDTPTHNSPNFGCPGQGHSSICYGNPAEMTMNFLDNTDDKCMYMFTQGQVNRMSAALNKDGPRSRLTSEGNTLCERQQADISVEKNPAPGEVRAYLQVYPNPVYTQLSIESGQVPADAAIQISIHHVMGQEVWRGDTMEPNSIRQINCANWSRGVYFIVVNNEVNQPFQKIILQ